MEDPLRDIRVAVRTARQMRGMSIAQLADIAGCGQRTLREFENGADSGNTATLFSICHAVGIELVPTVAREEL